MSDERRVVIYGSGGFAREVAWLAENAREPMRVVAFIDDHDGSAGRAVNDVPVKRLDTVAREHPNSPFVVAVGNPETRAALSERAIAAGLIPASLIHRNVEMSRWVDVGEGTVICAGSILTTNISLGRHVQINLDCTVGHDVVMEDFATLAPGVHISGNVRIARGAYLGTGACVINGTSEAVLVVGAASTVGAGAVVTRDVPPGMTVVGVPARARS